MGSGFGFSFRVCLGLRALRSGRGVWGFQGLGLKVVSSEIRIRDAFSCWYMCYSGTYKLFLNELEALYSSKSPRAAP